MNNSENKRITRQSKSSKDNNPSKQRSSNPKSTRSSKSSRSKSKSTNKSKRASSRSTHSNKSQGKSSARNQSKNKSASKKEKIQNSSRIESPRASSRRKSIRKDESISSSPENKESNIGLRRSSRNKLDQEINEKTRKHENPKREKSLISDKSNEKDKNKNQIEESKTNPRSNSKDNQANKRKANGISIDPNPNEIEENLVTRATSTKRFKLNEKERKSGEPSEKIEIQLSGSTSTRKTEPEVSNKKKVQGTRKKMNVEEESRKKSSFMKLLDIKVESIGNNFSMWRKIVVTDEMTFAKFARILVASFGWLGYWDWIFKINSSEILCPPDDPVDRQSNIQPNYYGDEIELKFFNLKVGDKLEFIYNTEDPWTHQITIEELNSVDTQAIQNAEDEKYMMTQHALVKEGKLSAPPDSFSMNDYEKAHEDFEKGEKEFAEWRRKFGEGFDIKFDKNKANEILKIYLYDETKLDSKFKDSDIFFKW